MKYLSIFLFALLLFSSCTDDNSTASNNNENIINQEFKVTSYSYNDNQDLKQGEPAPEFTLNKGTQFERSLRSFKGKAVLINFEAQWCGICKLANPRLEEIWEKYKNNDFVYIKVMSDYNNTTFNDAYQMDKSYYQIYNKRIKGNNLLDLYKVNGFPMSVLIDKDGVIYKFLNPNNTDFEEDIQYILNN